MSTLSADQAGGSEMVEIPMAGGDLGVHMSPIWPLSCSLSVHQNSQTSGGLDETVWVLDDNMHRRQFAASAIKRGSPSAGQTDGGLTRGPRFFCELQEVCAGSPTINGVSGVTD